MLLQSYLRSWVGFEPGHRYDFYLSAISYGIETTVTDFGKLTPFGHEFSPQATIYSASARHLVWLSRPWNFPENIEPTVVTQIWPADETFPTDYAIYWSPAKENSHQVSYLNTSLRGQTVHWIVIHFSACMSIEFKDKSFNMLKFCRIDQMK